MIIIAEGDYPVGRRTTRPVGSERTDFGYSYHFEDLPAGDYTVSIEMRDARRCRGGYWIPSRHRVSLGHRNGSAVADFNYAVEMEIVPIPISLVRGLLNDMLQGTSININNYPADFVSFDTGSPVLRAVDLWYGDSRIRLPEAAGGYQTQFNMPVFSMDPFTYYVNHIDLEQLEVIATSTGLKIRLTFETSGPELIKECHDNFFCGFAGDINMDLVVDVDFTLVRYTLPGAGAPGISIGDIEVSAIHNARMDGVCRNPDFDICNAITHYKSQMQEAIEDNVKAALDNRQVKSSIYRALRPTLDAFRIGDVNSVTVSGQNFVIRHTPPAP